MSQHNPGPGGGGMPPVRLGRRIVGMSAVLLPFLPDGKADWAGLEKLVALTLDAGLIPALNMDTGYGPLLSDTERGEALRIGRRLCLGRPFVAGACVADTVGTPFNLAAYQSEIEAIDRADGVPVILQSHGLTALPGREVVRAYADLADRCPRGMYAFELGQQFSPFGMIYPLEVFRALLDMPRCLGAKHSSLDRLREWDRLALRDCFRPGFLMLTGNDLAIDMVMYGSDYLLGLSTFHPHAFAQRDRLWEEKNPHFFAINDALQYLGNLAFRVPVPAYKHSAAQFLHLRGLIGDAGVHPLCARRPDSDLALLEPILETLESLLRECQGP